MMKKTGLVITFLFIISYTIIYGQTIQQLGYYNVNGIMSMSSMTDFMILGNGSLINISNPVTPNLEGSVTFPGFSASVLVAGNYAYFGAGMIGRLIIADISDPALPLQISTRFFPAITGGIFGMAKDGNILYLAAGGDGIYTVDISNPANPIVLDSIAIPNGQARDIVTHANFAYVAHGDGFKVIDISNPASINIIATIGSGYNSIDIDTTNSSVCLGKNSDGVDAFNIANPYLPVPAFSILNSNGICWDVKYRNNLVYLAMDNLGLFIYKVTGSSGVQMANFPNTSNGQSFAVALQDSLILLSGLINGVAVLQYDSLGVTGISEDKDMVHIKILPNPATNYFEFNVENFGINEIEIINAIGEVVYKENYIITNNKIDISNFSKGNYIISFKSRKKSWNKKLIKSE